VGSSRRSRTNGDVVRLGRCPAASVTRRRAVRKRFPRHALSNGIPSTTRPSLRLQRRSLLAEVASVACAHDILLKDAEKMPSIECDRRQCGAGSV